jgi:hypothetical protein
MNHDVRVKIQANTAAEVCQHFVLGEEAGALLQEEVTPHAFLDLLIAHELFPDAARLLAYALPKREAVWWACLCVRHVAADTPPAGLAALEAAERWVIEPHEAHRRAAMQAAEELEFQTTASWAAVAAFWSSGSMAPPEAPPVTPGEFLTA